ncbi:hypothetical protein ENHAE0001_1735 [Enhydrobacter aerosaccus SK60]|nr:hypothetical protein ENHAE0001_1735 [Enhydrobacter aerosaccus SK60]
MVLSSAMMTCDKVILNSLKGQNFAKSYRLQMVSLTHASK